MNKKVKNSGEENYKKYYNQILNSKDYLKAFLSIPENVKAYTIILLPPIIRKKILSKLAITEIVDILQFLDFDEITDLLQEVNGIKRKIILNSIKQETREKIEFLLTFHEKSAAGLMNLHYIMVDAEESLETILERIKEHESKTGKIPVVIVHDEHILGELELPRVFLELYKRKKIEITSIRKYIKPIPKIKYSADKNEILNVISNANHDKIIVVDNKDRVLGVIMSDDLMRLLKEKSSTQLYDIAGLKKEEDVLDSAKTKFNNRRNWLIINLATEFLAGLVVGMFNKTISQYVFLTMYLPIIAGMGGNAATQTLAVIVRGLTLKEVNKKTTGKIFFNELVASVLNALITGMIVAIFAIVVNHNIRLAIVVILAMIFDLSAGAIAGTTIPIIMKKLGKDPASSATIFITTITDVTGFFSVLFLAKLYL